ncbi:MAG: AEC family transporter [Myxococcota bacterium]
MLETVAALGAIVAPVYLTVGLGFLWVRTGQAFPRDAIARLIMQIGAPCLAFSHLVAAQVSPEAMVRMLGATLAALLTFLVVGAAILRALRLPMAPYLGSLAFGNTGNMGMPICLLAFGEPGLALAVCFFAATASAHFSVGVLISSGRIGAAELLRTPLLLSVVAAALVIGLGATVPGWLLRATTLLGDSAIPLMQLALGASLATLELRGLGRPAALGALRLGLGVAVGVGLASLMDLEGVARGVFILDCAMPPAVLNYLLAERYGQRPEEVASLVMSSTLLAFVTLPVLLAFVR